AELGTRHSALGTGHWALGTGDWALGTGHWALGTGHWALNNDRKTSPKNLRVRVKRCHPAATRIRHARAPALRAAARPRGIKSNSRMWRRYRDPQEAARRLHESNAREASRRCRSAAGAHGDAATRRAIRPASRAELRTKRGRHRSDARGAFSGRALASRLSAAQPGRQQTRCADLSLAWHRQSAGRRAEAGIP